ncbi:hypothetical protein Tco_1139260 [Tanacetum coccineum]
MDDPIITMEEYIRLEEEKDRRHGRTFNWQTATFRKVENYEDEDECFIDFETEFPAIVFDNTALPSEPMVCPPNENKVDFKISLDESDDEDYTVIFDENSFTYKIISVNDLKTDSGNDNDNMPLSPNPTIDNFDDLDFFKDFENEFPTIFYNDAQKSKSDYLTKPILNLKHIDEFNLNDETSLSEYDKENALHFNDLFNIIHPDDLKSEKDNDDNDIDIIQSLEGNEITPGANGLSETSHDRIIKTFGRGSFVKNLKVNIVILNCYVNGMLFFLIINLYVPFGIPFDLKRYYKDDSHTKIAEAMCKGAAGVRESCLEETIRDPSTFGSGVHSRVSQHLMIAYSISGRGQAPKKVTGVDLFYLRSMDRGTTNVPHLLAQYLFRNAEGRKSGARFLGGHFIVRLAMHFRLAAAAGAHEANEASPAADEGAQEIPAPAPAQGPLPPLPAPPPRTMSRRIERIEKEMRDLRHDVRGLQGVVESFTIKQSRVSTWLITCMTQLIDASGLTYQAFDSTLVGSSRMPYQRRARPRTGDASTSASPHTDDQPDP